MACAPLQAPSGHAAVPAVRAGAGVRGLVLELRESRYTVRGHGPRELNRALLLAAPRHRGRRAYGLTDWTLRWRYRTLDLGRSCRATEPEITLEITTHLPRWEDRSGAPATLLADWELFLTRLRSHEVGHRELVIREAARALEGLRGLAAFGCEELRRNATELVRRAEDRMWEGNRRYDRITDYGLGADPVEAESGR